MKLLLRIVSILPFIIFSSNVLCVSPSEYEARRRALGEAFDAQNQRIENNLMSWNRMKILEAAANEAADSQSDYIRCVFNNRGRDLLVPDCDKTVISLVNDLSGAREAVSKSSEIASEKNSIYAKTLEKIEQRDINSLRQHQEALDEVVSLDKLTVLCDGPENLRVDPLLSTYLSAVVDEKYRSALRLSSQSKRMYTISRLLVENCEEIKGSTSLREIELNAISIAFAEAMFEPKLLAAAACTSPGPANVDRSADEALGVACSNILQGVSDSEIDDFRSWLALFKPALLNNTCLQWVSEEFAADPSPLDSLRFTGLVRRVGNTPCEFPPVPASFLELDHSTDLRYLVSTILELAGDRAAK